MAWCVCSRFAWFCIFCLVSLGLGVGLSYPGKTHCKYIIGSEFFDYKLCLGVSAVRFPSSPCIFLFEK
jgi:hypothetical protein